MLRPSLFCVLDESLNIFVSFPRFIISDIFLCVHFPFESIRFRIPSTSFHNKDACLSSFDAQTISCPPSPILKSVWASAAMSVVLCVTVFFSPHRYKPPSTYRHFVGTL